MTGMSLLDVLRGVMLDPAEQAVYEADPGAYLRQYGYEGVDAADLSEAFGLVADTLPVEQAMAAYTGGAPPGGHALSATMGADTTDFDEPATALDHAGVTDGPDAGDEAGDQADDDAGDQTGDGAGEGTPIAGGFGEGERDDAPDLDTDLGGQAPDLSFGLGHDVGVLVGGPEPAILHEAGAPGHDAADAVVDDALGPDGGTGIDDNHDGDLRPAGLDDAPDADDAATAGDGPDDHDIGLF